MAGKAKYLIELDTERLFEERSLHEIIEIDKLLDAEIERKRNELRCMVGDRYKDILTASDSIKSMRAISEEIVQNIDCIASTCKSLVNTTETAHYEVSNTLERSAVEERTLLIQLRIAIFLNEQIWLALDKSYNLQAVQYYLLAQHLHTGLSLSNKEYLVKLPLISYLKNHLIVLRNKIFQKITEKLESVEITAEDTCSNLNALMLIENQTHSELLNIFMCHRRTALNTIINTNYSNVRAQVSSMVKCLITTILLLHDCFICSKGSQGCLLWQQLLDVVGENAPTTLSKLKLPFTPLVAYIPEITKQFKPQYKMLDTVMFTAEGTQKVLQQWLESTKEIIKSGLEKCLVLITNVKGLHLVREESLKIEFPSNWDKICAESHLPQNFDIWYHCFQNVMTGRARTLISNAVLSIITDTEKDISSTLEASIKSDVSESNLKRYLWSEDDPDLEKSSNWHAGLSMKARGYTPDIVNLCKNLDQRYFDLLKDVSQYLYGREFSEHSNAEAVLKDFKYKRKYIDRAELEVHLRIECTKKSLGIINYINNLVNSKNGPNVIKSIISARFLQAICNLCPYYNHCCTISNTNDDWNTLCDNFNKTSRDLWTIWVEHVCKCTEEESKQLCDVNVQSTIRNLQKWNEIEIQEQTDDKVFKSRIKVPWKTSLHLTSILLNLNDRLGNVLPQTLPKSTHITYIERNVEIILRQYRNSSEENMTQLQSLQFLFDVKFLTFLCIPRENTRLVGFSQEICDKYRSKVDPFDLDVSYSHLLDNARRAVSQSQVIFGCLIPYNLITHLSNIGGVKKNRDNEKTPSVLAISVSSSTSWFPLLPITAPTQKNVPLSSVQNEKKLASENTESPKKFQDPTRMMKQSAASLFGGLTSDWFS